ncbi:MAG: dipeptide ABC transporter ATP-binding protein [Limnochordia bacterium]|nr:dipeptide ABC transporter ATP-binding protein [Limnochordia bacterium]
MLYHRENAILQVEDLCTHFPVPKKRYFEKRQSVKAVNGVSFSVREGETVAVVGESGCGKTTLGLTIMKLLNPTSGHIHFQGHDITHYNHKEMRPLRKDIQIIFQDPYASLDPRQTVEEIISEPIRTQRTLPSERAILERVLELMDECGLERSYINRYPHEFSGGQRQRIGIARALSLEPKLIVCDEPVSALDVSIQSQILNLLRRIKERRNLSLLFISHDLAVVHYIADSVVVMYLGKIVEMGSKKAIYRNTRHPYTQALLSSVPQISGENAQRILLEGDMPSPVNPPEGCLFHTRCPMAIDRCHSEVPELKEVEPGHFVACWLASVGSEEVS